MKISRYIIFIVILAIANFLFYLTLANKFKIKVFQKICVIRPKGLSEASHVYKSLQKERICIVDLTNVEVAEAQRIIDYICGTMDALDCKIKRLSNKIFIVMHSIN